MKPPSWFICIFVLGVVPIANAQSGNIAQDFEAGPGNWSLFVPKESANIACSFTVENTSAHSGQKAARLTTTQKTRFGMRYAQPTPFPVAAGQRYLLTAWIKAGADFVAGADSAGPVIRATLLDGQMKDVTGGHSYIGLLGVQRSEPALLNGLSVPNTWTKIEGVIEIPAEALNMVVFVFNWKSSGTLWVDDVSVTKISGIPGP